METLYDKASLILNPGIYDTGKVYCTKPLDGSGDLTFTRASNATRVNADGLIEKVRTNVALYSEDFSTWSKPGISISTNTTTAPDGTLTADTLTVSSSISYVYRSHNALGEYTISCYVKAGTNNFVALNVQGTATHWVTAVFDLSTGAIGEYAQGTGGNTSYVSHSITSAGSGWYRCSLTINSSNISTATYYSVMFTNSATGNSFNVNYGEPSGNTIGNTLIVWGAQYETGAMTDYIPTTTAAVSVGPVSGLPRLDYSGGATCPSLLLEPQRTNLYPYSSQLNQWTATQSAIVTANYAVSPDGYTNADRVQFTAGSLVYISNTGSAGENTMSVYAKATNGTSAKFRFFANGATTFSSDQTATGEWQRFTFTYTYSAVTAGLARPTTNGGVDDVIFYGFQHEIGSYATSYIPTLGSAVTRLADSVTKTISAMSGSGYTSTLYFEIEGRFNPGTIDQVRWYPSANIASRFWIYTNVMGSAAAPIGESFPVGNLKHKFIFKAESSTAISIFYNGVKKTFSNSATTGNGYDTLEMYGQNANEGYKVSQILAFPTALTDQQCIELTTL
jgi:hypothetical protein